MNEWMELKDILFSLKEANASLSSILYAQREAIMERDIEGIESLVKEQEEIKDIIAMLEQRRAEICRVISDLYAGKQDLLLPELLSYAPERIKDELVSVQRELKTLLENVKREARIIRYVLNTVLRYISDQLNIFTKTDGVVYNSLGSKEEKKRSIFFGRA